MLESPTLVTCSSHILVSIETMHRTTAASFVMLKEVDANSPVQQDVQDSIFRRGLFHYNTPAEDTKLTCTLTVTALIL